MKKVQSKLWFKSKTLWTSLATIATGVGLYFSGERSIEDIFIMGIGIVFAYLRTITDTQIK